MKILVAGATGLAGSAIFTEFTRIGEPVIGISSKDVDLTDRKSTFDYLSRIKPTVVINAAAKVGGIAANNLYPVEFLSKNIQIQTNLMDASHNAKVERFIFLASSCVYPRNSLQPIKEKYLFSGPLETTNSAYAIAKISGIELINSYRKEYGYKWISVMPTNLYGPNDNFDLDGSHVFPALIRKFIEAKRLGLSSVTLWGSGNPRREFLHSSDLAKAIVACLNYYDSDQPINIGSGLDLTIKELSNKIALATDYKGDVYWDLTKPDGTPQKVLDIQKITSLGWKPDISLDKGIRSTIDWYVENH
jgi:GDP-L-fucose synthase